MDGLDNAREMIDMVFRDVKETGNATVLEGAAMAYTYAAIAQAEQLKRIADRLDSICAIENDLAVVRTANVRW